MKNILLLLILGIVLCVAIMILVSCGMLSDLKTGDTEIIEFESGSHGSSLTSDDFLINVNDSQNFLKQIYDNVHLKDGKIHLSFGATRTLTVRNFNRLILEEQLGCTSEEFTFVIDENLIDALKHNDAYGGIAFGQEWVAKLDARIKNVSTGEISDEFSLWITLHKSYAADRRLSHGLTVIERPLDAH